MHCSFPCEKATDEIEEDRFAALATDEQSRIAMQ